MFMSLCPVFLEIFIRKYDLDKIILFYFNFLKNFFMAHFKIHFLWGLEFVNVSFV